MEAGFLKRRPLLTAIACVMLMTLPSARVRADWLCVHTQNEMPNPGAGESMIRESYVSFETARLHRVVQRDGQTMVAGLKRQWEEVRLDLTRGALEVALTMFFIKTGSPPPKVVDDPPVIIPPPPPPGGGGDPPPPPPDGSGEPGPGDPPVDSPEPASLITALFGVGFASTYAWRRRRVRQAQRLGRVPLGL